MKRPELARPLASRMLVALGFLVAVLHTSYANSNVADLDDYFFAFDIDEKHVHVPVPALLPSSIALERPADRILCATASPAAVAEAECPIHGAACRSPPEVSAQ